MEKPENLQAQGICPVRSSKANRLSRIKPDYYHSPARPVFVPDIYWLNVLALSRNGSAVVVAMKW